MAPEYIVDYEIKLYTSEETEKGEFKIKGKNLEDAVRKTIFLLTETLPLSSYHDIWNASIKGENEKRDILYRGNWLVNPETGKTLESK